MNHGTTLSARIFEYLSRPKGYRSDLSVTTDKKCWASSTKKPSHIFNGCRAVSKYWQSLINKNQTYFCVRWQCWSRSLCQRKRLNSNYPLYVLLWNKRRCHPSMKAARRRLTVSKCHSIPAWLVQTALSVWYWSGGAKRQCQRLFEGSGVDQAPTAESNGTMNVCTTRTLASQHVTIIEYGYQ